MEERWKPVPGYEGLYEVSDRGRVRSIRRQGTRGKVLRQFPDLSGYCLVSLGKNGKDRQLSTHRLVLLAFRGPCPPEHETAHLNGIRDDNRLENLSWETHQTNVAHKKLHGTNLAGEKQPNAKLTWEEVREIRERYAAGGVSQVALAREYGVADMAIHQIVSGKNWKDPDYDPPPPRSTAKLTWREVRAIRGRYAAGASSQTDLAREYQVSRTTIYHIIQCKTWKDDPDQ